MTMFDDLIPGNQTASEPDVAPGPLDLNADRGGLPKMGQYVKEQKQINGKWYYLHQPTGTIYERGKDRDRPVDDPAILEAFGKTKVTKKAQENLAAEVARARHDPKPGAGMFDDLLPQPSSLDQFAARYVTNPIMRGKNQSLDPVIDVTGLMTGTKTPEQFAEGIVKNQQEAAQYPQDPRDAAAMQEFQKAQGFWQSLGVLLQNPSIALQVGMESAPASLAVGAGGMAGAVGGQAAIPIPGVGAGIGLATGTGLASAYVDFTNSFVQALTDTGQPLTKESVLAAVNDPVIMAKAKDYAVKHGMAVGAFDAISAGIAGRIAKPIERLAGTGVPGRVAGAAGEVGAQAALGAGGEASGQIAATGKVNDWKDVALEGVGEVVTGPLEIGQALASREAAAKVTGQQPPQSTVPPQSSSGPATGQVPPQGQRVEPQLFPGSPPPAAAQETENTPLNSGPASAGPTLDEMLVQAGMAPTDIASMSRNVARNTVRDLVEQGALPTSALQDVENWPVSRGTVPQPGQAPIAPRTQNGTPEVSPAPVAEENRPPSRPLQQGEAAPGAPQVEGQGQAQPVAPPLPTITPQQINGLKAFLDGKKKITPENIAAELGVDLPIANRLIQEGIRGGGIMQTRSGGLRRPPVRVKPDNAVEFIASVGGMRDERGELQARDARRLMTPYGPLARPNGKTEDQIRELLVENGYLTDAGRDNGGQATTTVEDVYRLIDQHLAGKPVYAIQDQEQGQAIDDAKRAKAEQNMMEAAGEDLQPTPELLRARARTDTIEQVKAAADEMGIRDFFGHELEQIAQDVEAGTDIYQAIENAIVHSEDIYEQDFLQQFVDVQSGEYAKRYWRAQQQPASVPFPETAPRARQEPEQPNEISRPVAEAGGVLPQDRQDYPERGSAGANLEGSQEAGGTGAVQGEAGQEPAGLDDTTGTQALDAVGGPMPANEVFPAPDKIHRPADEAYMPLAEAKKRVASWKEQALAQGNTGENAKRVILSLFDYTGTWSQPYYDAGFTVLQYDIRHAKNQEGYEAGDEKYSDILSRFPMSDILEIRRAGYEIYGVLSACPCTTYAASGARWWKDLHDAKSADAIRKVWGDWVDAEAFESPLDVNQMLTAATQAIVEFARPTGFHVMENPVGRIAEMNDLPDPLLRFNPNNYGDPYTKKTQLWGSFSPDLPTANVEPTEGSKMHKLRGDNPEQKNARSTTPEGFSYAFFMANNPRVRPGKVIEGAPAFDPEAELDVSADVVRQREPNAAPTTETGADNKPQTVLPGAEAVSEEDAKKAEARRRAQAELEARKKQSKIRRGGQESIDTQAGGLFEEKSGDLFAAPAPKPAAPDLEAEIRERVPQILGIFKEPMTPDKIASNMGDRRRPGYTIDENETKRVIQAMLDEGKLVKVGRSVDLPKAEAPKPASSYGSSNTLVTKSRAEELRAKLKAKLDGTQLNAGIDPEMLAIGAELAAYHIEAGVRSFSAFARQMATDLGVSIEKIRPYLRSWYNGARDLMEDAGLDISGMDGPEEVRAALKELSDAPGSSNLLEPDRGAAAPQDLLGEANVPASASGDGSRAGSGGKPPRQGKPRRQGAGERLSQDHAPVVGENGNLELPAREPQPAPRPAPDGERSGGGPDSEQGLFDERIPTAQAVQNAQKAADLNARREAQRKADSIKVIAADKGNVAATLPMLFPEQQDDVFRAEQRFAKPDGHGMLFTNGTGTGKTYSGLGVAKRFAMQGKKNILIVAPSQGIIMDWIRSAKDLSLDVSALESTTDNGKGIVATTYANLGANKTLADREWDLVIADESHKLSSDQNGTQTAALGTLRAITLHPDGLAERARMVLRADWDKIDTLQSDSEKADAYRAFQAKAAPLIEKWRAQPRPKALMMSATPFAYHFSLDYAEGYLFEYDRNRNGSGYNSGDGRDQFYMQHLGYRMRTNKLTKPDAGVNAEVMERQLHEKLRRDGSLWGRALEVDRDYDRKFILVDDVVGNQIDQALSFLTEADDGKFRPLYDRISKQFDYLTRMRLLEAIKAENATSYIKKSLALGRKVVVFHDYNEGGGFAPFDLVLSNDDTASVYVNGETQTVNLADLYREFLDRNPYVAKLDFSHYRAPIAAIKANFPNALIYNGTVPVKKRDEAKKLFNDDNSGYDIIVVQSAAGEAGISLHDITNVHQRVLLNLGMPIRPTTSIQQEGRIYRVGQASDALFRYMNTGTNWERWTFAGKIAERAGTAENLALGDQARTIRQSFIDAFSNSDFYEPQKGEGTGGKAADKALSQSLSEFEKAKTHYWAQQKNTRRRDQREGVDYYATPEPIGLKMVEWANIRQAEKILEPSAGHGAIARYFPETTARTMVEPSNELASRAALNSPGARVVIDRFENLDLVNKYDAIVMNPPFGSGGKTAIEHLAKAVKHLKNGGRVVALIPRGGSADKRFDDFMESDGAKGVYQVADILLPSVAFERAGTAINAHVVVLEKQTDKDVMQRLENVRRDFSNAETVNELFDRIEHAEIAPRLEPLTKDVEPLTPGPITAGGLDFVINDGGPGMFFADLKTYAPERFRNMARLAEKNGGSWFKTLKSFRFQTAKDRQAFIEGLMKEEDLNLAPAPSDPVPGASGLSFTTGETIHSKTKEKLFVATLASRVERDAYTALAALAKKHGGWYSNFKGAGAIPGFQFKSEDARIQFLAEAKGDAPKPQGSLSAAVAPKDPTKTEAFKRWFAGSKIVDPSGKPLVVYHHGTFEEQEDIPQGFMHFGTEAEAEADAEKETDRNVRDAAERNVNRVAIERMIDRQVRDEMSEGGTKYSQYTLPGGENYRELLLTLPPKSDPEKVSGVIMIYGNGSADDILGELSSEGYEDLDYGRTEDEAGNEQIEFSNLNRMDFEAFKAIAARHNGQVVTSSKEGAADTYRSSHWDEPNVLAHIRFNERTDADGKKVLFIEEIQSDWHQAGRKKGYKTGELPPLPEGTKPRISSSTQGSLVVPYQGRELTFEIPWNAATGLDYAAAEMAARRYLADQGGVPDAPFKTTWPELAFKRMIRYAAENGFDRIAWAPGEVQADRYDLSKQIDQILHKKRDDGTYEVRAEKNGHTVFQDALTEPRLAEVFGKDIADKIVAGEGKPASWHSYQGAAKEHLALSGLDLKVGGEGMRAFYDKMLVDVANKLGKKFGAKVGRAEVPQTKRNDLRIERNMGGTFNVMDGNQRLNTLPTEAEARAYARMTLSAPSIDITPAMQKAAMEGQPLFRRKSKPDKVNPNRFIMSPRQEAELVAQVNDLSSRILGHHIARVNIIPDWEQWTQGFDANTEGEFNPDYNVISLALQGTRSALTNLRHEAIHALRQAAVFTKPEWAMLSRMADLRWMEEFSINERYAHYREQFDISQDALNDILREEAVAEAFAHYLDNKLKPSDPLVARIFEKVKQFLEALANYLKGRGFTTVDQVFGKIESGAVAKRQRGAGEGRGYHLTARQQALQARVMPRSNPNTPAAFVETDDSAMSVLMNQNLGLLSRIGGAIANATLPLRRGAQDKMADWARQQEAITAQTGPIPASANVYRAETLYHGRTGERLEDLRLDVLEPIIDDIAARGLKLEDVDRYLYARHAPERNAYIASIDPNMPDGGSGMTNAEAQQVMADFRQAGKLADVQAVASRIDAMKLETAKRLLQNGIIDQQTYDAWYGPSARYQNYVPLQGFEQNPDEDARIGTGKRYDTRTKVALKALGRRSKADSPFTYMIAQAQQSIILSEKARVGRAVLRLARRYPNPRLWEVNQVVLKKTIDPATGLVTMRYDGTARTRAENVLAVREGGNLYWVTIHHEGLAAGIKGTEASNLNVVFRNLLSINRFLAMTRTGANPEFFIPNFLRDLGTAGIHISADQGQRVLKGTLKDLRKAFVGSWKGERGNLNSQWAQYYREFAQAGGKVGLIDSNSIEQIKKRTARDLWFAQGGTLAKTGKAASEVLKLVTDVNAAVESSIRLSLYVNMRKAGYSPDDAAFAAKEVTVNFNRKGEWGNMINALYLFFNASIQGTARIALGLKRSKLIRRVAFGLLASGFLMDMLNAMIAGDDDDDGEDDYDQMPEFVKERNIIIPLNDGTRITIPLPWVYNVFYYAGVNAGRAMRGKVSPMEGAANIGGAMAQAANPLYAETWVQMITPTVLDPGLDLYTNQDWKGDPIRPEDKFGVPKPNSQKYWQSIPEPYRYVAEKLNSLTGGDEVRPGLIDISPEDMQYVSEFITGGVGQLVNNGVSTLWNFAKGGEVLPERIPFSRKVVSQHSPFYGRTEYYQMRDAVALTEAQMKNAREDRDRAKMDDIRSKYGADLKAAAIFDAADKQLKEIRKQRQKTSDPDMRKLLDERANAIMAKTRKRYRELLKAQTP